MVGAGACEEVGHQGSRLGNPLLIARLGLKGIYRGEVLVVVLGEGGLLRRRDGAGVAVAIAGAVDPVRAIGHMCAVGATSICAIRGKVVLPIRGPVTDGRLGSVRGPRMSQSAGEIGGIGKADAPGDAGGWCRRYAVKCVVLLAVVGARLEQGRTGFLVGQIGLSRVGEKGQDGRDAAGGACLAGGDHDAQIHEVVVELGTVPTEASLYDVDILSAHRVLDLAATFARRKFAEDAVAGGNAQNRADALNELWVGVAPEDHNVSDHGDGFVSLMGP